MKRLKLILIIIIFGAIIIFSAVNLLNQNKLPEYKSKVQFAENAEMNFEITGEGNPVLFIHGLGTDSGIWKEQIDKVKKNYKVITVDLYGHGESENIPRDITIKQTAGEILNLLIDNDIDEVDIVAHGLGGLIALDMKNININFVKKLILLDTPVKRRNLAFMDDIYLKYIENNFERAIEEYFNEKSSDEELKDKIKSRALKTNKYTFYNYTKSMIENDFLKIAKNFDNKNIYLFYSKTFVDDKKHLEFVKKQHGFKDVDDNNIYYYPNSGFFMMFKKPEKFLKDIEDILKI
ncbi:MAG: alpha/beta hydrolase [Candidatus Mcinerneyibacterium aminivorans]|uniref:Alpha/beta hydrolase n=1 Tax=Candidatus Mcinerneyibacterium aminivorans TaxID=2703815 RepID=A0A5D0MI37_9BACT|nr:MAG: alpha/beta hydrolase [Candidatus Mcinerneyibacterium aminivorans]